MKNNFLNSLLRYLVEKDYYHLISADNQMPDLSNGITSMIREIQGTSVFVEIIDADRYGTEQIRNIMLNGAAMLNNIQGSNAHIFKVFVFESTTDMDKVEIIKQHQLDITSEKRFMKCISLNISTKQVEKYFSVPAFDAGLVKSFKRFFSKGLDERETDYQDIEGIIEKRKKDFEIQFKAQTPWLTYIIIALNIVMYGLLQLVSMRTEIAYEQQLEPFGAKVNNLIMEGQYWRFFAPMFLHADIVHLAVNCYSIYIIGSQVEKIFGRGRFLAIYFVSGFIGSAASFAFSLNSSVGASGAIFGLVGAMLYFSLRRPALLKSSYGANLITMLVINLAYGFMNKRIDNHAHIGGFVGGFLTTGAVYSYQEKNGKTLLKKAASLLLVAAIAVGMLFYGFNNDINALSPKLAALEQFDIENNWPESEKEAEEILELNPSDKNIKIRVLWSLIRAEVSQGKLDEGIQNSKALVELSPAEGHYLLGVIYYNTKEFDKAKQELEEAKKSGSTNTENINEMLSGIENSK
ncbi:rhomboid family protein [Ruminiclostridium papyrosolvens]|uniref:Protease n=1 Tax=Ruminiclostridium papyrosolvens C7 TaxID=1330534 RepID=U4R428_9FIRM|nr:rhomboid family intramembrane serine protease [Ruminiclostridium papyrosolvens]EPR13259.1 protease [Ruminiclostridium papyrosolvens C7]